jgi:hypothetical protein
MYVLSIHDLSKRFGKTQALHHGRLIQGLSQAELEARMATSGGTLEDYFLTLTQEQEA